MKILVLRVINSSRHRKCFVRSYMHSLLLSKALTRSFGFLTQATHAYNPVSRTFYDVNYIYDLYRAYTGGSMRHYNDKIKQYIELEVK